METIKKSVVIVGSGGAGLRCAIELRENGQKDILIVGDRKFTNAHTTCARGGINAALATMDKDDTPMIHAVDTYREAVEVAHPDLVERLAKNAPDAIADLVNRGARFHQEDDGTLTQRFFGAHSFRRTCFSGDKTGLEMIRTLAGRANELEIPFLELFYVYKLLTKNGRVQGIEGVKDGKKYRVEAPVVVFATGGFANVYRRSSSRNRENFGEGVWMALQAGAQIGDIELVQFHPTGLMFPEDKAGKLVTEAMRGEGALLYNADSERFMEKYDPDKMELSTRDVVARANFREIKEGRGTPHDGVYLDISHRDEDYIKERLPKMYSMIKKYNDINIANDPVEVAPTTHYTMGGIHFDPETMATSIEGFYVAGECTMGLHGANRLGGNSLMETMVYGKEVGKAILGYTPKPLQEVDEAEYEFVESDDDGLELTDTMEEVRRNMWKLAGILRKESELVELKDYLADKKQELKERGVKFNEADVKQYIDARRLKVVLDMGALITKGALERKESRGAHFRVDYPEKSDTYRKNYIHEMDGDTVRSFWKETPEPSKELQQALDNTEKTKNYGHAE